MTDINEIKVDQNID